MNIGDLLELNIHVLFIGFLLVFQNEFSRGLVILAMEKLNADIPELMYDDHLFSHAVDETLCFHNEMRNVHGYPASHVSCLQVLTQPQPFNKWINIEQKCK